MYLALAVLRCLATLLTVGLRVLQSLVEAPTTPSSMTDPRQLSPSNHSRLQRSWVSHARYPLAGI